MLSLLAGDGAASWQRRRLRLGDLLAALGDTRPGVGLLPDGLPDIGSGEEIRLPTEYEWEKAARGSEGHTFPWGEGYHSGDANIDETYDQIGPLNLRETTAVGLYPRNVSPYGLVDCSGNVWEWCLNKYDDPEDTDTAGEAMRALRGGCWSNHQALARASARFRYNIGNRSSESGFRLVCSVPIGH